MFEQLSIFDFLPSEDADDLDTLDEYEMIRRVEEGTGLKFTEDKTAPSWLGERYFFAEVKKVKFDCHYSKYFPEVTWRKNKTLRFISCGYECKKTWSGCGAPADTVEEAIEFFKRAFERLDEGTKKARAKNETIQ